MIVAGFGFRAGAMVESLHDALRRTGDKGVAALATVAEKADAPAFLHLSNALGLPIRAVAANDLTRQQTVTRSEASLAAHGTGSVAEAAALAAAGPGARLLAARVISGDGTATCALAEGADA